jgi:predicted MPP superfamily phosphohydrolase
VDDPHDYHTEEATRCLENKIDGFRILLAHSPELYRLAAANSFALYLCGHSHGGQICLPGGWPLMTCLDTGRRFFNGLWRYGEMIGHTSPGCGTAKIPIRFNCRPEITVLVLNSP